MDEDFRDTIRERAYELWELAGKPEDMEDYFWLEAEKQIHKERIESGGETWDNSVASVTLPAISSKVVRPYLLVDAHTT